MTPDATSRTLHEAARLAVRDHRYQDAARALERAIAHEPSDAWAHDLLGIAYQRMGRAEDALRQFEQSVASAPDHAIYLYNYGAMLISLGQIEEGLDVLSRCLECDPGHEMARELLGRFSAPDTSARPQSSAPGPA
jgi:Tfp pilus assembly protein PilF